MCLDVQKCVWSQKHIDMAYYDTVHQDIPSANAVIVVPNRPHSGFPVDWHPSLAVARLVKEYR